MAETNLAQAVEAASDASRYDTNVKYILADKQILTRILKYAVKEFQDMEIQEIMESIGNDIEIGTKPVDAGLSNLGRVMGGETEDSVPGEGKIFYDIRFTAYHKKSEIKFLINIEAQKSSDAGKLGYHLENRIIFYLARMISAQKQTEFYHSDFDNIKRVRSIWICMDNEEDGDSIEEIGLERKTVFGNKESADGTDLMKAVIINIREGDNLKDSGNTLISMLEKVLSGMAAEEKRRILEEDYGMIMTTELEERIQLMCNLSENIEAKGIRKGMEKGVERGRREERIKAIENMIKIGIVKEQIISCGYTEEEFAEVEEMLLAGV